MERSAQLLDIQDVADRLGISEDVMMKHVADGDVAIVPPDTEPAIHETDLQEFLEINYPSLVGAPRRTSRLSRFRRRLLRRLLS